MKTGTFFFLKLLKKVDKNSKFDSELHFREVWVFVQ